MRSNHRLKRRRSNLYSIEVVSLCIFLFLFLIPVFGSTQEDKKESRESAEIFSYHVEYQLKMTETPRYEPNIPKAEKRASVETIKAPVLEIGDTWVYESSDRRIWEVKVVRTESNLIITQSFFRGDFHAYDRNTLEPKYTIDQLGRRSEPTIPYVDFPLHIGKKWKQNVPSTSTTTIIREYKCLSYENVTVPAGKLKVAKIKFIQTSIGGPRTTSGDAYIWYSPEVRNIVKIQFEKTGYWIGAQDIELTSFKPKDKDVFLSQAEVEKKEIEEIPNKFSYLIENGAKMIRENEYENVLHMIEKLPSEKKWDFRVKVLENFAYLKGYFVSKNRQYGKNWQSFYKPMVFSRDKIATPILVELLKDDDPYVRSFTAKALGYLGDKRALGELKRIADQDQNSKVRSRAKWAYEQVAGDRSPGEPLEED